MLIKIDGENVFVTSAEFTNIQESEVVFGDMREFATAAFAAMVAEGKQKAEIIIDTSVLETDRFPQLVRGGLKPRVTIEWIAECAIIPPDMVERFLVPPKDQHSPIQFSPDLIAMPVLADKDQSEAGAFLIDPITGYIRAG